LFANRSFSSNLLRFVIRAFFYKKYHSFFSKLLFHRKRNAAYDIHDRVVEMSLRQDERCCTDVFDDTNNAHAGLARDCG
jgi:hypothetical protein